MQSLREQYAPLLRRCAGVPVLYCTWGYRAPAKGSEEVGNFLEMTEKLLAGYQQYAAVLGEGAIVAPVGPAFRLVFEERPALLEELYHTDHYHPSPLGTFLAACVLLVCITGLAPQTEPADPFEHNLKSMMGRTPTAEERCYLADVAVRLCKLQARAKVTR